MTAFITTVFIIALLESLGQLLSLTRGNLCPRPIATAIALVVYATLAAWAAVILFGAS